MRSWPFPQSGNPHRGVPWKPTPPLSHIPQRSFGVFQPPSAFQSRGLTESQPQTTNEKVGPERVSLPRGCGGSNLGTGTCCPPSPAPSKKALAVQAFPVQDPPPPFLLPPTWEEGQPEHSQPQLQNHPPSSEFPDLSMPRLKCPLMKSPSGTPTLLSHLCAHIYHLSEDHPSLSWQPGVLCGPTAQM